MENELEEGQLVLCTVDKVIGTTVFVKLDSYNVEGTITTSEIAPGRIRNLRDYVVPNKKIVCKIIKYDGNKIQLSLRRVKPNERKELLDKIEKENSYKVILKTVLGKEKSEEIINKISQEKNILELFEEIKSNPKIIEDYVSNEEAEKIIKILESKKDKPKEIKQVFKISSKDSNGILIVKKIIQESCSKIDCSVTYIASGKYSIKMTGPDFKEINNKIQQTLLNMENQSKKQRCDFSIEK